jgi:DNA polymerase-4
MLLHHALTNPQNARVIFVDMNGFFASVEQQDNPSFRNKPVAVISHDHPRATVLASSYEAKAFGITTGTKRQEAQAICPGIIFVEPKPGRYKQVQQHIIRILVDLCGPEVQPRSIDEAAVFLSPNWQGSEKALALAHRIKARFKEELGEYIRCSIGIAPNSLLAKLATDLQKPDGLVEITQENIVSVLESISLTDLPGIAERMAKQLEKKNITTPLQLYERDPDTLRNQFGIWGQYWWWRLHGFECDGMGEGGLKSMSHEHVLHHWVHSRSELEAVLIKMTERLLHRLHHNNLQCRSIFLSLRLAGAPQFVATQAFDAPTVSYPLLLGAFQKTLDRVPEKLPFPVRKICIGMFDLTPSSHGMQLDMFNTVERGHDISMTITNLRERFGYDTIHLGSTLSLKQSVAKEQLGFGRIRDV